MRYGWIVLCLLFMLVLPIAAQDAQSTPIPPIRDESGVLQTTLEANDTVEANDSDSSEAQLEATLAANTPPVDTSGIEDNSGDLQATLQANDGSKSNQIGAGGDESGHLSATLEANDPTLVPDTTSRNLTPYLPSNIFEENIHQILTIIALVVGFALVWKLRQRTFIDMDDRKKKKKR